MERRDFGLTGVQSISDILKITSGDAYASSHLRGAPQVQFVAHQVDEPTNDRVVPMLDAMSVEERGYYAEEDHVVDHEGKSHTLFKELESH